MKLTKSLGLAATLGAVLLILAACGGGADEAADNNTDTLAVITPTPVSSDTSSPMPETSTPASNDEDIALVFEEPPAAEGPGDDPESPWGKDLPTGPAPTVPPAPPSDFDSDGDGMYTLEEFEEAIRYRFPEYEWPPNYQMTEDRMIEAMRFDSFPQGSQLEAPGEYTALGLMHQCAWELTLIDASLESDQLLIDESLYQLVEFGQNKNPLSHDENGKAFQRDMYDRAALGDIAPLQQWVDNNCDLRRQYFITPDSATPPTARRVEDKLLLAVTAPTS